MAFSPDNSCAKERAQPKLKVQLVFPDGQPAVGVTARTKQIIMDRNHDRGRYYPDKRQKHSWLNAALGVQKTNGPSRKDGSIIIQGKGVRKPDEHIFGIRDLEQGDKAGYEIEWSGGLVAPETRVYEIDTFPSSIELKRGVEVILERHRPAPDLSPVVVRQIDAWRAVSRSSDYLVAINKVTTGKWRCILEDNTPYVIGYPEAHHKGELRKPQKDRREVFRGFVSEPFIAKAGKSIPFTPGLPCTVTADFSRLPKTSPIFPCSVELYRRTERDECKQDGRVPPYNRKLTSPQLLTWKQIAPGDYYFRIYTTNRIYETRDSFGDFHYPVTLTSGENHSVMIEILKVDREVSPGDISISGYLKDSQDGPIANRKMVLVPGWGDKQFGLVSYPMAKTNKEGSFEFSGVAPDSRYDIGYERSDGSFGTYPVNRKVIGLQDYVLTIHDFKANTTGKTFSLNHVVFESTDKQPFSIADHKGKTVVVDYWATWCGPCLRKMPSYNDLAAQYRHNDSVVFWAVSVDSERILWEEMMAKKPWQAVRQGWLNPVTNHGRLGKAIPYIVIYDAKGSIVAKGNDLHIKEILTKLGN